VTRLKTYLLNGNACKKFLQSPEATELTKVVEELKAALVFTAEASGSELERSLTSPYCMFQVRTGAYKLKVAMWKCASKLTRDKMLLCTGMRASVYVLCVNVCVCARESA